MKDAERTQEYSGGAGRVARYLWLLWIVWLSFLVYPLNALYLAHPAPGRVAVVLGGAALFVAVYVWNIWRSFRRLTTGQRARPFWPALALLLALALALTLDDRRDWIELFIFIGASMGPSLPGRQAAVGVTSLAILIGALGLALHAGTGPAAQIALQGAVSGFAVIIVVRTIVTERELRLAREEIARLAVSEERLRFARDLHDLLGHSLSLIALKSELAGRLVGVSPEKAAREIQDVEQAARTALQEVREAVSDYRQPTLASELKSGREILSAAGIDCRRDGTLPSLPASIEATLAWAVREGVTNVIKHSRARCCTIRLLSDTSRAGIEVIDDGQGATTPPAERSGSGLSGLSERVAALGGRHEAGPCSAGGFRLAVSFPLTGSQGARSEGTGSELDAARSV